MCTAQYNLQDTLNTIHVKKVKLFLINFGNQENLSCACHNYPPLVIMP